MNDCIFCKIVTGEIPSFKYWEDKNFICILDINPNIDGASLFISKDHYESDYSKVPDQILKKAIVRIKTPVMKLKKTFNTEKVGLVIEGVGVNHLHIKLYPLIGLDKLTKESTTTKKLEEYPGYISTQLGPRADMAVLEGIYKRLVD